MELVVLIMVCEQSQIAAQFGWVLVCKMHYMSVGVYVGLVGAWTLGVLDRCERVAEGGGVGWEVGA